MGTIHKPTKEHIDALKQSMDHILPLSDSGYMRFQKMLSVKEYKKDEYFNRAGEVETKMGFIYKGSFRWYYLDQEGNEANYNFFFEKEYVTDYKSFLTQQPSLMNMQALEDSTVVLLPPRDQLLNFNKNSARMQQFWRIVAESAYITTSSRTESFLIMSAEDRYKNLLQEKPDIFERLPLYHIASYLGMIPQTLSRIRAKLAGG